MRKALPCLLAVITIVLVLLASCATSDADRVFSEEEPFTPTSNGESNNGSNNDENAFVPRFDGMAISQTSPLDNKQKVPAERKSLDVLDENYIFESILEEEVVPGEEEQSPEGGEENPEPTLDEEDPKEDQPGEGEEQPGEGQEPGQVEQPGEGENPGEGQQQPGENEQPGQGEEPGEGQEQPGEGENPGEGEQPGESEEPGEGEEPGDDEIIEVPDDDMPTLPDNADIVENVLPEISVNVPMNITPFYAEVDQDVFISVRIVNPKSYAILHPKFNMECGIGENIGKQKQ